MEGAKALIRSAVRAFYDTEHIIIVDAMMIHSALRDDDLALLMGQQVKPIRRLLGRLREDGMISVHSRQEIREGYTRPVSKDYFYVNFHRTIDVIKYRLYKMTEHIKRTGLPTNERKELICPRCKSEWTALEAADHIDALGNFLCHKCDGPLQQRPQDDEAGGENDMMKRFNQQLADLMALMQKIDDMDNVPENDFQTALDNMVPVKRDENIHPTIKYEPTASHLPKVAPQAVRGLANTGPKEIEIDFTTSAATAEAAAAAKSEHRARIAAQNQLPEWHTRSTITGNLTAAGTAEEAARAEREREAGALAAAKQEEEDQKLGGFEDNAVMDDYFAQLRAAQEREKAKDIESDEEEEEDDDFEDVEVSKQPAEQSDAQAGGKANGVMVNGAVSSTSSSSAATTPRQPMEEDVRQEDGEGRETKRAKVEPSEPAARAAAEEHDEEDDFEDALY